MRSAVALAGGTPAETFPFTIAERSVAIDGDEAAYRADDRRCTNSLRVPRGRGILGLKRDFFVVQCARYTRALAAAPHGRADRVEHGQPGLDAALAHGCERVRLRSDALGSQDGRPAHAAFPAGSRITPQSLAQTDLQ